MVGGSLIPTLSDEDLVQIWTELAIAFVPCSKQFASAPSIVQHKSITSIPVVHTVYYKLGLYHIVLIKA